MNERGALLWTTRTCSMSWPKMPATPEGRGTVLTIWGVYQKGVRLRRPGTFSFLIKASTSGMTQLHDGSTKVLRQKRLTVVRTSEGMGEQMDLERKDWWQ